MYTSATKAEQKPQSARGGWRTVICYAGLALLCILIDNVYALFGHGVRSAAMDWMFLYPLLGGALFYALLRLAALGMYGQKTYRAGYNLYNAGIAALSCAAMLQGVFEIAGTASAYVGWMRAGGWGLCAAGLVLFGMAIAAGVRSRRAGLPADQGENNPNPMHSG